MYFGDGFFSGLVWGEYEGGDFVLIDDGWVIGSFVDELIVFRFGEGYFINFLFVVVYGSYWNVYDLYWCVIVVESVVEEVFDDEGFGDLVREYLGVDGFWDYDLNCVNGVYLDYWDEDLLMGE